MNYDQQAYQDKVTRELYKSIWQFMGLHKENGEELLAGVIFHAIDHHSIVEKRLMELREETKKDNF